MLTLKYNVRPEGIVTRHIYVPAEIYEVSFRQILERHSLFYVSKTNIVNLRFSPIVKCVLLIL